MQRVFGKWWKDIFSSENNTQKSLDSNLQNEENYIGDDLRLFSYEYRENKQVGHVSQAPEVGSPSLTWHVGVWMQRKWDPSHAIITRKDMQNALDPRTPEKIFEDIFNDFKKNRRVLYAPHDLKEKIVRRHIKRRKASNGQSTREWVEQLFQINNDSLNSLLINLQKKGRLAFNNEPLDQIKLKEHDILKKLSTENENEKLYYDIIDNNSICFSLWWFDEGQDEFKPGHPPPPEAIRIRVHVQMVADFYTVSFYIDASKAWNLPAFENENDIIGDRRKQIYDAIKTINNMGANRLTKGTFNLPLVPESDDITLDTAKELLEARNYLYSKIWHDFRADFGFKLENIVTPRGRCFINMRGLALSVDGLKSNNTKIPHTHLPPTSKFHEDESGNISETSAVLRSYWPFIRRITPFADFNDHVACGLMDWKALLVTALGASQSYRICEEWDDKKRSDIQHKNLPEDSDFRDIKEGLDEQNKQEERNKKTPIRFLILSKKPTDRKQLGRILDRINVLETFRLFVLKDWSVLKNADTHIRLRGQELDAVMEWWSTEIASVHEAYRQDQASQMNTIRKLDILKRKNNVKKLNILHHSWRIRKLEKERDEKSDKANERRDQKLTDINQRAETYLINIGASIDSIGKSIVGGMQYRVNRSSFYIEKFNILINMLKIGKIDTWMGYDQFVDRGLKPEFVFIQQISGRLKGLRERLEAITQSIQTSAIVVQASATRNNTKVLKDIAFWFRYSVYGLGGIFLTIIAFLSETFTWVAEKFGFLFKFIW